MWYGPCKGSSTESSATDIATRINNGELHPGDRLPAERQLLEQYGVARSVVRQALAGLARDGLVAPATSGYHVLSPRILWLSSPTPPRRRTLGQRAHRHHPGPRHRPRRHRAWHRTGRPSHRLRALELRGRDSDEGWAIGHRHLSPRRHQRCSPHAAPQPRLRRRRHAPARRPRRRIIGYHERIHARHPTEGESTTLNLSPFQSVLVFDRTTRTTTTALATLSLTARADRFEVDYLTDA